MAADQPTPDDDPSKPRGAGWDDDEWVRRDLGPRPEVPGHGARPLLMGLPILLITIAAVVAILVAGCGEESTDRPAAETPGTSLTPDPPVEAAANALKTSGTLIAGRADAKAFADATCEPVDGAGQADFRCAYGADGSPDSGAIRLRLQDDGTVTKILGSDPPAPGQKTSAQAQTLLAADDAASGAPKVRYICATSTPVNQDGTSSGASGTGQRCVLIGAGGKPAGQRYVGFAPDGTALQDFLLP